MKRLLWRRVKPGRGAAERCKEAVARILDTVALLVLESLPAKGLYRGQVGVLVEELALRHAEF
jgi:hypothetical protein